MLSIHSHTRYLVLLLAVLVSLYAIFGMVTKRRFDTGALVLLRVFTGILDLQVLLGIITIATRPFFPAIIGHVVMMVAAAAVAHLGAIRIKKTPETERSYGWLLVSALLPLVLIVGGIMAIHRAII